MHSPPCATGQLAAAATLTYLRRAYPFLATLRSRGAARRQGLGAILSPCSLIVVRRHNGFREKSIRHRIVEHFPAIVRGRAPDDDLADALYALLWSTDQDMSFDGWALLRIVRESPQTLDAVGLMTLLPSGSVPIAITVRARAGGFEWSVRIARLDARLLALSSDKQWSTVYLYATTESESPPLDVGGTA